MFDSFVEEEELRRKGEEVDKLLFALEWKDKKAKPNATIAVKDAFATIPIKKARINPADLERTIELVEEAGMGLKENAPWGGWKKDSGGVIITLGIRDYEELLRFHKVARDAFKGKNTPLLAM